MTLSKTLQNHRFENGSAARKVSSATFSKRHAIAHAEPFMRSNVISKNLHIARSWKYSDAFDWCGMKEILENI